MKINREKLIKFYDEKEKEEGRGSHVSAITGIWGEDLLLGVLQHYWKNKEKAESKIVSYQCVCGNKKGPRLDGWLLKITNEAETLHQVEIKNWAAYSIGGNHLSLNATEKEIEAICKDEWSYYFGGDTIPEDTVSKALEPMKVPDGYGNHTIIPLICFWFYIAESIRVPYSKKHMNGKEVHVFSASAYLRSLTDEYINVAMPRAERRISLLSELISGMEI